MKVGVVGAGAVGAACIMAIIGRGGAHEIVVIDKDEGRVRGLVTDMQYGTPLCPPVQLVGGSYADLEGAELVLVAVGINEKAGGAMDRNDPAGRLRLLGTNAAIIREIVPQITAVVPRAPILVITNPPEPLAELARRIAGHDRVHSSGTYLDTLRFRFYIARQIGVHPAEVDAQCVGEHGNSRVLLWSSAQVAGTPVRDLVRKDDLADFKTRVEMQVRNANITIIEGINASQYGIGMACGRVVEAMTRDERAVFPLGCYLPEYGVTLSVPAVVGREGVVKVLHPRMSDEERAALERSAATMRQAVAGLAD
ncbi:MAG: lactate dehydrogenase [Betaproteobacteria bacterium]|nr:lactate dehydrogenase [Betaproteobacteria bacterium]